MAVESIAGLYESSPTSTTDTKEKIVGITQKGALRVALEDASGNALGSVLRAADTAAVTAAAYSAGNAVGALRTFSGMALASGLGGILQTVIVRDKAGQNVNYDLFLFDASPSSTTVTDKSAVAVNTADLAKIIGVVSLTGIVLGASSTTGVLTAAGLGLAYKLTSGTTIYGILVTRGAPTYTSTSDVSVELIALPG
jgi:hypothetical protein